MQTEIIKALMGAAGASGDPLFVDDVFSTYLYEGNNSTLAINNGLDLATEGGMIWVKNRDRAKDNCIVDTERGIGKRLETNKTDAQDVYVTTKNISSFTSTGFTLGVDEGHDEFNRDDDVYASWSFRKAKGFFDVVEFTQESGTPTNQRISHSLGSAPGMIWMKCTSGTRDWFCYHRSLGKDKYFKLNSTGAAANATNGWGTSEPDATEFGFNANEFGLSTGSTYVAYLFAHDDQSYGEGSDQSIIKCGTFNRSGGTTTDVDVGWQPQYVFTTMYEGPSGRGHVDEMRGFASTQNSRFLRANADNIENNTTIKLLSSTGFTQGGDTGNYIYMAIRRPDGYVGKPPELGTDVFAMDTGNGSGTIPAFDSGFPVDYVLVRKPAATDDWDTMARIMSASSTSYLITNTDGAETTGASNFPFDSNVGWAINNNSSLQSWMWKRHAGFDVVAYTGNGTAGRQISHGLSKTPEMMWVKRRTNGSGGTNWLVYHKGLNGGSSPENYYLLLNGSSAETATTAIWNDTAPTSTHFTVGNNSNVNSTDKETLAILFASVEGISKVGSYSGSSSDVVINLGFQPRFMIVKAYNSASGNQRWQVMDTVRGMAAGATATNRIYLDDTQAQQAGPYVTSVSSTGITLKTGYSYSNTNTYEYVYYAHA